jgi:hypothetical protein
MARSMCFSVILLALVASSAPAPIILRIQDEVDEYALIDAVSGQKPVKDFSPGTDSGVQSTVGAPK